MMFSYDFHLSVVVQALENMQRRVLHRVLHFDLPTSDKEVLGTERELMILPGTPVEQRVREYLQEHSRQRHDRY